MMITLAPTTVDELCRAVAEANGRRTPIRDWDLAALNRVLDYHPEDMTITVEAGLSLAELQKVVGNHRQWLPSDPVDPDGLSIGALISENACGPRRSGYGTVRDHLLGIRVVTANGQAIRSGGKVVKNVAGYDLMKLFVGSRGSLGIIVEATFKLLPLPEVEEILQAAVDSPQRVDELIENVFASELNPVILDLHNLTDFEAPGAPTQIRLVIGFAGAGEDVEWQTAKAARMGFTEPATLDYEKQFQKFPGVCHCHSVLSSAVAAYAWPLMNFPLVARAGSGSIACRGGPRPAKLALPATLLRRVKEAFDSQNIFPPAPW